VRRGQRGSEKMSPLLVLTGYRELRYKAGQIFFVFDNRIVLMNKPLREGSVYSLLPSRFLSLFSYVCEYTNVCFFCAFIPIFVEF